MQHPQAAGISGQEQVHTFLLHLYRRNCRPNTLRACAGAIQLFLTFLRHAGKAQLEALTREDLEFREAEDQEEILFVDEVDSFLHDCQQARRSWEVNQVNELLSQMEHFKGLFACASNLREELDTAVFRRLDFKIKLDYLREDQAWKFFRCLAKELKVRLSPQEVRNLRQTIGSLRHLAPGDFAVVRKRTLMAGKKLSVALLMEWLEQEVISKPINSMRPIGFS